MHSLSEVFLAFLRLGCTSFGGPVAHLGYFREEFVVRRRWLTEAEFAEAIALAQSLPGPASSQVAFALGMLRRGWAGAWAAWAAFTLPSAVLMLAFALAGARLTGARFQGALHGLQIVAVAVVAQAVFAMQRTLAPDLQRIHIAIAGAAAALFLPERYGTLAAIVVGALFGLLLAPAKAPAEGAPLPHLRSIRGLSAFALFLVLLALPATGRLQIFAVFYRSGALIFGGGHVVLPVLHAATVGRGWLSPSSFLAGYGAAQAMPGPLFTFAAYLGTVAAVPPRGIAGGLIALMALSLPGLLLMAAVLPYWGEIRSFRRVRAVLSGVNAAVVGLLAVALWHLLRSGTIAQWQDAAVALTAFLLLYRLHPWKIVLLAAVLGALMP